MASKDEAVGPLRFAIGDTFLPMLAALAVLVLTHMVPWQDACWAAGGGTAVAVYRLWSLTPWMQRRYERERATRRR